MDLGGCGSSEPFALQVTDNSMEPEFKKGCIITCRRRRTWRIRVSHGRKWLYFPPAGDRKRRILFATPARRLPA